MNALPSALPAITGQALATPPAVAAPARRVYGVLLGKKAEVEAALTKLAKKSERKKLGPLVWSWGKAYSERASGHDPIAALGETTTRVPLTLETARPHYAGWTFLATLQHLDGENIVRAIPGCVVHDDCRSLPELAKACIGGDLPTVYRERGPVCDHCNLARKRHDTYVLRHDSGKYAQVGSTCIADFLGSDEAEKIAMKAELAALAGAVALSGEAGEGRSGASSETGLGSYLAIVSFCVRRFGWTSRTAARENSRLQATADVALTLLYSADARESHGYVSETADTDRAEASTAWAEALTDEDLAASSGDYLHNLRAVARTGLVSHRTAGIAASMVTAYDRAMGRIAQQAERAARPKSDTYVGTLDTRIAFGPGKVTKKIVKLSDETVRLDYVNAYVFKFLTNEGACLVVWKNSVDNDLTMADVGKRYAVVGTVKKHEDYRGEKQTTLSRPKVTESA